jgi:hypothetical protein
MKAQYLPVQYLIFFTIGLVLIISVYVTFSNLNQQYEKTTTEYQLQMTGEMIMGSIIRVYETSNSTNTKVEYNLSIPTKLSNCIYSIKIENGFLKLDCIETSIGVNLTSYNFNIEIENNIIYSTNGLLQITAKDGRIDLK